MKRTNKNGCNNFGCSRCNIGVQIVIIAVGTPGAIPDYSQEKSFVLEINPEIIIYTS
jgi:hypothetical protein